MTNDNNPTPIENLLLKIRYREKFKRAGIKTIDELCKKTPEEILKLGTRSMLRDVRDALATWGRHLKNDR